MSQKDLQKYVQDRIIITDRGCWEWQERLNFWGYGEARLNKKHIGAHRLAWLAFRSEIPKGLLVCHHCDIPACVNPEHLYIATQKQNMLDCAKRGRAGNQKLRKGDYAAIKRLYDTNMPCTEIAKMFGISAGYVGDIGNDRRKAP